MSHQVHRVSASGTHTHLIRDPLATVFHSLTTRQIHCAAHMLDSRSLRDAFSPPYRASASVRPRASTHTHLILDPFLTPLQRANTPRLCHLVPVPFHYLAMRQIHRASASVRERAHTHTLDS